ncbi:hypothetical protein LWX53_06630 [bacterium]|nr:hypothetical protein [bacterium]
MGQQRDAQKSSAKALREILGIEVPEDDGAFLSPEETDAILTSLEEKDQLMLGGAAAEEEGVFISPEELEPSSPSPDMEDDIPDDGSKAERRANPEATRYGESVQSDLLSRIAGELRSIKSEIGSLRTSYDVMLTKPAIQAGEAGEQAAAPPAPATEAAPEAASGEAPPAAAAVAQGSPAMPDAMLADLKKLLGYMDRLLESLPEDKIDEFARSEYFDLYRKIYEYFDLA